MGRRTLTAHCLEFHRKRKPEETYAPCDLDGDDLFDKFLGWCKGLGPDDLQDPDNNLWVECEKPAIYGRFLLVPVEVGSWGERGALRNRISGATRPISEDEAPTGRTRAVLYVPDAGEKALFFSEYSGRGSGGKRLLSAFATYWGRSSDFTMVRTAVTEGEAWAEAAQLREVEVRVRGRSDDLADRVHDKKAIYSHVLRAPRLGFFRRDLLSELKTHPARAADVVGIPHMPNDSEVLVTLRNREGRQKKFVLGEGDGLPALREELNGPGEQELTDDAFAAACRDKATDLLSRI